MELSAAARTGVERLLYACEGARIVHLARDAGVEVVLYKGAALAELAYGGCEHRGCSDIDLLVRAEDFGTIDRLLAAEGYRPLQPLPDWMEHAPCWGAPTLPYEMHYRHETTRAEVDLHAGLLPKDLSAALDERALWSRLQSVVICDRAVPTLGTVDTLLFLALHGTKHQWEGDGNVRDFGVFSRERVTPETWREALAAAEAGGCRDTVLVAVRIAEERLGFTFPAEVSRAARGSARVASLVAWYGSRADPTAKRSFRTALFFQSRWRYWDTLPQRLAWLLKYATTPNINDYGWLHLPRPLGALYYLLRPVRLAWKFLLRQLLVRPAARRMRFRN